MRLYLLRHGIAKNRHSFAGRDELRPLTKSGIKQMGHVARRLKSLIPKNAKLYSSPFIRAKETAYLLADELGQGRKKIRALELLAPGTSLKAVLSWLSEQGNSASIVLVGHEPELSTLAAALVGLNRLPAIVLKKGGACGMQCTVEGKKLRGLLLWLLTPKLLGLLSPSKREPSGG